MNVLLPPRIIKHFPGKRQQIIDLCTNDRAIGELCEDYEKIIDALTKAVMEVSSEEIPESSPLHDLVHLKQVLEQELQDRLGRQ